MIKLPLEDRGKLTPREFLDSIPAAQLAVIRAKLEAGPSDKITCWSNERGEPVFSRGEGMGMREITVRYDQNPSKPNTLSYELQEGSKLTIGGSSDTDTKVFKEDGPPNASLSFGPDAGAVALETRRDSRSVVREVQVAMFDGDKSVMTIEPVSSTPLSPPVAASAAR